MTNKEAREILIRRKNSYLSNTDMAQAIDLAIEALGEPIKPEQDGAQEEEIVLEEIPIPIGTFILENASGIMEINGMYYHYKDVVRLLDTYASLQVAKAVEEKDREIARLKEFEFMYQGLMK